MKYIIKGGRVIDPAQGIDDILDVAVTGGSITAVGKSLAGKADEIIDAGSRIVAPGFIDMHAHLREPGREDEETILTGTRAAVRGGFTTVLCMPNTEPPLDGAETIKALKGIIDRTALCRVEIAGAITELREGKRLADFARLKQAGIIAISDDGSPVEDPEILQAALKLSKEAGLLVIEHCEDAKISSGGVMNEGFISTKMGLRGIPAEAEHAAVKRDIEIAKKTNCGIHIAHVSCRRSVELIAQAKRDGVRISAETAPHYFTLTEEACATYDTNTKMNPPLRTHDDVAAIKEGLADGAIDAIATDHAPHTDSEKDVEFDFAPFGIIGLETALGLVVTELIEPGILSWKEAVAKMSHNPAKILGLRRASLKAGEAADIVIIDPAREYAYKKDMVESKSRNSPFIGRKLKAPVTHVLVDGRIVMRDGKMEGR